MESQITKSDISLQKMREVKRLKSVEDKRVGSEVFDRITLKTLYKLANQGYIHLLNGAISTGKEANVFKGADEDGKRDLYRKGFICNELGIQFIYL